MCLLDLFLRVQLNLLGSHVYLSAALRDPKEGSTHSQSGGPTPAPGRPALSLAAQHAYLALHSHFIREGTKMLVPTLAAHCQVALAECVPSPVIVAAACHLLALTLPPLYFSVPLKAAVTYDQLCGLLALANRNAMAALLAPGPGDGVGGIGGGVQSWCQVLMPPRHTDAALVAQQAGGNDAHLLAALLDETRAVLAGGRFATVLASAMDAAMRAVCDALRPPFTGASAVPMAKLVPVVAAATDRALKPPPPPSSRRTSGDTRPGSGCAADPGAPQDTSPREVYAAGVAAVIATLPCVDALCADLFSAVT